MMSALWQLDTEQANTLLTNLNEQHPTMKFERELPVNKGYLPILNKKLNIDQDGNIQHKLYTKPAAHQRNTELKPFRRHEQN